VKRSVELGFNRIPSGQQVSTTFHVLLVANSATDGQESMLRFAEMLRSGLAATGCTVEVIAPPSIFGRFVSTRGSLGKWIGYIDKYLLFPFLMRRKIAAIRRRASRTQGIFPVVHICDHSNAPYVAHVAGVPCVVTCHDLGAVRGALGEATYCPASATGKLLQRWILRSLARPDRIVCDSAATERDARRLLGRQCPATEVVLLGLNQTFSERPAAEIEGYLAGTLPNLDLTRPFLLHVGSSHPRKNRDGILRIFHRVKDRWDGGLVFAGEALPDELVDLARKLGISERVTVVEGPATPLLEALYNRAFALIFPSRFEGFGWPLVEAQACGCPVLCSDSSSVPEVAGAGAFVRAVQDEDGFAEDILRLEQPEVRAALIQRGRENLVRFRTQGMIDRYMATYRSIARAK